MWPGSRRTSVPNSCRESEGRATDGSFLAEPQQQRLILMQIASTWPEVRPLIVSLKYAYMWPALEDPRNTKTFVQWSDVIRSGHI